MGIWFLHDNHTATRLDTLPVEEAMAVVKTLSDTDGSGFVGTKELEPNTVIQWQRGEPWENAVRALLESHATPPPPACALCAAPRLKEYLWSYGNRLIGSVHAMCTCGHMQRDHEAQHPHARPAIDCPGFRAGEET